MPEFTAEICVMKRMFVKIDAPDTESARQKLNNLEFDPEQATEIIGWQVSPKLLQTDASRPYGKEVSALDLYKRQSAPPEM